ncbi:hypothetical protein D3C74_359300 [compost metagenome]
MEGRHVHPVGERGALRLEALELGLARGELLLRGQEVGRGRRLPHEGLETRDGRPEGLDPRVEVDGCRRDVLGVEGDVLHLTHAVERVDGGRDLGRGHADRDLSGGVGAVLRRVLGPALDPAA